jgi:hypothetical protein
MLCSDVEQIALPYAPHIGLPPLGHATLMLPFVRFRFSDFPIFRFSDFAFFRFCDSSPAGHIGLAR